MSAAEAPLTGAGDEQATETSSQAQMDAEAAVREMRAIILAGGRGTRLAPYTSVLPKPLMPIGDRSILEIVIEQLTQSGFRDIVLSVGYLSHLIRAVLDNASTRSNSAPADAAPTISYVAEDSPLGTAGPLRLVENLNDTFLLMNGDLLTNLDYVDLVRSHLQDGNAMTIATQLRTTTMNYGVLHVEGTEANTRRVTEYVEKPDIVLRVSTGVYVLEPRVLAFVPPGQRFDFPDLVHALLAAGEPVGAYTHEGLWFDIGRHEDYESALTTWENWTESSNGAKPFARPVRPA